MPIFMQIEGVNGNVTGKYKNWFELNSVRYGSGSTGSFGQKDLYKDGTADLSISKNPDPPADMKLLDWYMDGRPKGMVTIDFTKKDGILTVQSRMTMEGVMISAFASSDNSVGFVLNYNKIAQGPVSN